MVEVQDRVGIKTVRGQTGDGWLVWCVVTQACVVIDGHHAEAELSRIIEEESLTLVARLGTDAVPKAPVEDEPYQGLLADLGLTADPEALRVGPVKGWAGSRLVQVGSRIVELDATSEVRAVYRPEIGDQGPRQVNVRAVTVCFGQICARLKVMPQGRPDTVAWRVGHHLVVPGYRGPAIPGYEIHGRAPARDTIVQLRRAIVDGRAWADEIGVSHLSTRVSA